MVSRLAPVHPEAYRTGRNILHVPNLLPDQSDAECEPQLYVCISLRCYVSLYYLGRLTGHGRLRDQTGESAALAAAAPRPPELHERHKVSEFGAGNPAAGRRSGRRVSACRSGGCFRML